MQSEAGAITASSSAAAEAGAVILRKGGNAVDAAVATALASCVADPGNNGIGGYGGHMIIAFPGAAPVCVDFDCWVPASSAEAYRGAEPGLGPRASVIPNVIAGLSRALEDFGTMEWDAVSEPAISLARDGVSVNETTARAFEEVRCRPFIEECVNFERPRGGGLVFRQPRLAQTLETMAEKGPGWFYDGPIGEIGVRALQQAGHPLDHDAWISTPDSIRVQAAPHYRVDDVVFYSAPLRSSGSIIMFGAVAAGRMLARVTDLDSPEATADWAKKLAALWTFRMGTPGGNHATQDRLETWIDHALASEAGLPAGEDLGHTCHLNAADRSGAVVAMTLTHGGPSWFGGHWTIPGTGIFMNAGAYLLASVPPVVEGGYAYAVTNMAPTVVRLDNGGVIAAGCPGSRRIPGIIGLALARHLWAGMSLQDAVDRGRFHAESHEAATYESGRWGEDAVAALRAQFARVEKETPAQYYGPFTAIRREADARVSFGLDTRWPGYRAST